ncbi:unnamed protein product [Onchocerca flexuosa]|uniref:Myotubularin phosphatase domain-containing protein n=1 Tax=Onchocerca flexuosa TaxID=387005 RepID=A0A183HEG3_9BILA|nr:unnamed protein product [Onchocerca flexuosa]
MDTSDKMMEPEYDSVPNESSTDLFDTSNVFDTSTITNKTVMATDLHSYSCAKSSIKVDEQWIAKSDDQSIFVVNDQNLTWPRSQSNPAKQSSGDYMKISSLNNYKKIYEKQFDCSRNHDSNESGNYSSIYVPEENDSQSSKTMISVQGFESVVDCNQDQPLSNNYTRIPHKVLLNTPASLQVIKSISNISRYSGNVGDDGICELTPTGVTATSESIASSTNSSVDSGQGSTELSFQNCSYKDPIDCGKAFAKNSLPTYARVANTIDHVLRVCSMFHTALNGEKSGKSISNLVCEAKVLITSIQCSPCFTFLSAHVSSLYYDHRIILSHN